MNLRSITRRVLRAQSGVGTVRHLYQLARYAPAKKAGKYGGALPNNTPTSQANAPIRRAFLASHLPRETPAGRRHRLKEASLRQVHAARP